jgi:hypothetical protein
MGQDCNRQAKDLYVGPECNSNSIRKSTLRERLELQINHYKSMINEVELEVKRREAALARLKKNPDLELLIDMIQSGF